jgi:hypothetical protein
MTYTKSQNTSHKYLKINRYIYRNAVTESGCRSFLTRIVLSERSKNSASCSIGSLYFSLFILKIIRTQFLLTQINLSCFNKTYVMLFLSDLY